MTSAVFVFVGNSLLSLPLSGFAAANVILVGIWLVLARGIIKERIRLRQNTDGDFQEIVDISTKTAPLLPLNR